MEQIINNMADLKENEVLDQLQQEIDKGTDALALLNACKEGMVLVGKRYEEGTYFISDLMMAGEIFKMAGEILAPKLGDSTGDGAGKVVMGTVAGDIHDIGKDLVVGLLRAANFEVTDLGVDVPTPKFIEAVKNERPGVLALSGLLTVAFDSMKDVVAAMEAEGLRDNVKIMIGGGPVDETVCRYTGADAWGADAQAAVNLCNEWMVG